MKSKHLEFFLAIALVVTVVSGFATTWTQTRTTGGYGSVSMSADGRIICAAPSTAHPVISTNWGQTWAVATNTPPWGPFDPGGVAVSADGTKIIASLGTNTNPALHWIFISLDYGVTWMQADVPSVSSWHSVTCSANGSKLIAATVGGPLYFSTNSGANWRTSSVPNLNWRSVASSADGRRMVGAVNGGNIYFSTNFGAAWTPTNLPVRAWRSVCLSSDGQWVGAIGDSTYISGNAGADWTTNEISGESIACSANGTNWIIAGAQIYTSSDSGRTWLTNLATAQWEAGLISADSSELVASAGTLGIWVAHTIPTPQLDIRTTNGNLGLFWLVPSTNFVLQQNSDLSSVNWVTVSNQPSLNFTTLREELAVPATNHGFFRLIAQ